MRRWVVQIFEIFKFPLWFLRYSSESNQNYFLLDCSLFSFDWLYNNIYCSVVTLHSVKCCKRLAFLLLFHFTSSTWTGHVGNAEWHLGKPPKDMIGDEPLLSIRTWAASIARSVIEKKKDLPNPVGKILNVRRPFNIDTKTSIYWGFSFSGKDGKRVFTLS